MHDSRNIDHAIGKPLEEVTSEPAFENAPYGGVLLDLLESGFNRVQELLPKPFMTIFIKQCGLADFRLRGRIETDSQ